LKSLGIMGSPRIKGNTDLLLDEALNGAQSQGAEVDKLVVDKLKIAPCREFYGCLMDGNCVIRDDMDDIYPKLLNADIVIVASPVGQKIHSQADPTQFCKKGCVYRCRSH